jgi:hypothetical protein
MLLIEEYVGALAMFFFTGITGLSLLSIIISGKRKHAIIDEEKIKIRYKRFEKTFNWKDIDQTGPQLLISKRLGVEEGNAYWGFSSKNIDFSKIPNTKEYGFVCKKKDLDEYKGDYKYDIYILATQLNDKEAELLREICGDKYMDGATDDRFKPLVKEGSHYNGDKNA